MNDLLKEEYFHLGTDHINLELWNKIYMDHIKNNYIKPIGGLWSSHLNDFYISDWLEYMLHHANDYQKERLYYAKACLVKFKEDSKLLTIETNNDYKNLKDSGYTQNLSNPIPVNNYGKKILINEILDYDKIFRDFNLLYIFPLANESLHNYSVNTMFALKPEIIDYYKPIEFDINERKITCIGDKKEIEEISYEYKELYDYIKTIFNEYKKSIIYINEEQYINELYKLIERIVNELESQDIPYLKDKDKKWYIKSIARNIFIDTYTKEKTLKK